ncbi:MAG TPA: metallohydrolase [Thermoanaerobaculia bacterium]|nr:metallohydrolase [Thermoanaerobaculia bacterium]
MGNHLLIRAYRVGCGDCIYVRIPQGKDGFHILIDCGKKGSGELLERAIKHLEATMLPDGDVQGKKRLDLIVATHRHEDHIKGFDEEWFKNIQVKNVWLSAAMDPKHPQAQKTHKLHAFAGAQMRRLADSGRALSPQVEILASAYAVSNDAADDFLMKTLPKANKIKPKFVHAGMTPKQLGLDIKDATIRVLAPEEDIDHFYLGEETDATLKGLQAVSPAARLGAKRSEGPGPAPKNISAGDFRLLQSGMLSNGLAFAAKDTAIQNNLSVVLLIEWKKRRLLFVGDAEWEREFKEGKDNGSWNVMWHKYRDTHLKDPVDFLKIGHHGSVNATPPAAELQPKPKRGADLGAASIYRMLDTLLPAPKPGKKPTAQAIVSTEREFYNPIPECAVLVDLARRVSNTRSYGAELKKKNKDPQGIWISTKAKKNKFFETYEKEFLDQPQPLRTDLEFELSGAEFIDVEIPPGT